jgi:hypothetical protein
MHDLWVGTVGTIGVVIGAIIGALIPYVMTRLSRADERSGEVVGMLAELERANAWAAVSAVEAPEMPKYRLPLSTFGSALPKLIGEMQFSQAEVNALLEYTMLAEEFNRDLERLGTALVSNNSAGVAAIRNRLTKTADRLKVESVAGLSATALRRVLGESLNRPYWAQWIGW